MLNHHENISHIYIIYVAFKIVFYAKLVYKYKSKNEKKNKKVIKLFKKFTLCTYHYFLFENKI